ncbi:MAG: NADH-quinone oxidoreductase subunit N [Verrucomicrobiae bacterium]|nr:NADH-quinone oxidoreductase subunit N [Verrucomicrobiae bacterium]
MPAYTLEIIVFALGLAILMVDAFAKLEDKRSLAWLGILGLLVAFGLLFKVEPHGEGDASPFWLFYSDNRTSLFYKGIALLTTIVVLLMAVDYRGLVERFTAPAEKGAHSQAGLGEFFALPVLACGALMCMASAIHLVSIFVSLEAVTITFYIMVAYLRRNVGSLEAGVKYLILGALSTGFLVYGFAWLYGVTGSMELPKIAAALNEDGINTTAALFSFALILVALGFKVGAAPFQLWIPDVYQGAPTPITAFLSVASKAAGFVVLLRVSKVFLESTAGDLSAHAATAFAVIAGLTLLYGNLAAIPQTNFKRLLAYSSIAHAGFLLAAIAAAPTQESGMSVFQVVAFYLGAYLLMTLLAFLVVGLVRVHRDSEELEAYRGLGKTSPFLALVLLVAMASLAGVPLTAGFFGKFFVFKLVVEQHQWGLLVLVIVGAAAGFYYYLKVVASMYWQEPVSDGQAAIPVSGITRTAMVVLIALIIVAGFAPGVILSLVR